MRAAPLVALLTGCSSWFGLDEPALLDAGSGIDAAPLCLGEGELQICVPTPSSELVLHATIDTNNCTLTAMVGATEVCVHAGTDVRVMATSRATGGRPLVVFAVGELHVTGLLDVA